MAGHIVFICEFHQISPKQSFCPHHLQYKEISDNANLFSMGFPCKAEALEGRTDAYQLHIEYKVKGFIIQKRSDIYPQEGRDFIVSCELQF